MEQNNKIDVSHHCDVYINQYLMGSNSSKSLPKEFTSITNRRSSVTYDAQWVIGCIHEGKVVIAPPIYCMLLDFLQRIRATYGGIFLVRRDLMFCEWRSEIPASHQEFSYMVMIPNDTDAVQQIYDSKHLGYKPGYTQGVRELGFVLGSPLIDLPEEMPRIYRTGLDILREERHRQKELQEELQNQAHTQAQAQAQTLTLSRTLSRIDEKDE